MDHRLTTAKANALGFLACVGMMAFAFYQQYALGHEPCHLCILQRISVITLGLTFLAAALHNPAGFGRKAYGALFWVCAGFGLLAAGRNVWVQLQPAGSVPSCGAPLNVLLQMMPMHAALMKVFWSGGECQTVDWSLFGLSMAAWVVVCLSVLLSWSTYINLFRSKR